jgi:transposase
MHPNTERRHAAIVAALREGKTAREAAEEFGYTVAHIRQIAKAANLPSARASRRAVIAEMAKDHTIKEIADHFGMTYRHIWVTAKELGITPKNGHLSVANPAVIASAREHGLTAAARIHGITRERVRQICVKHEAETGEHIERGRRDIEVHPKIYPQTILCADCRTEITIRSGAQLMKRSRCQLCSIRRARGSRLTHEIIENVIAERLAGGRNWHRIALSLWYTNQSAHQLTRATLTQLRRANRREEIARLWPKGLPYWLQKYDRPRAA